jgi:hypothetical protein
MSKNALLNRSHPSDGGCEYLTQRVSPALRGPTGRRYAGAQCDSLAAAALAAMQWGIWTDDPLFSRRRRATFARKQREGRVMRTAPSGPPLAVPRRNRGRFLRAPNQNKFQRDFITCSECLPVALGIIGRVSRRNNEQSRYFLVRSASDPGGGDVSKIR